MTRKVVRLVRYISPFGSPAWMPREEAERHLVEDDQHWLLMQEGDNLSPQQKVIGPPRIEHG